jgi:polysaccharide deacetylase 2 family uncharacterized protein YibQ
MQAVEFYTHIENGIIHLPMEYVNYHNADARIIVLVDTPNSNKNSLKQAFEAAAQQGVFKTIEDPKQWQKEQRNDWE